MAQEAKTLENSITVAGLNLGKLKEAGFTVYQIDASANMYGDQVKLVLVRGNDQLSSRVFPFEAIQAALELGFDVKVTA